MLHKEPFFFKDFFTFPVVSRDWYNYDHVFFWRKALRLDNLLIKYPEHSFRRRRKFLEGSEVKSLPKN